MVFIYGGSFINGASYLYPSEILTSTQDIVVVTINYRLNAFGFLSSMDPSLLGNYGLWDQRLAIQWVKDNIADYGGNPNKITLFGESAGAFAITDHMISPQNDVTLFQRAITESGSVFSRSFAASNPLVSYNSVAKTLGCQSSPDVVKCLRAVPFRRLLSATMVSGGSLPFFPVADNDYITKDFKSELLKFTKASYSKNLDIHMFDFPKYDVFSGWNSQEGLLYMGVLSALSEKMTGRNISNGLVESVFKASIQSGLIGQGVANEEAHFVTNTLLDYYMNNPHPMASDNRSTDDRRLEAFVNLIGKLL